ncbi:MAG: hypothetical protein IT515_13345 [Burkholderiales bacterium]|nr:hypothetical protein [Burkholderiales bacterium]
MHNLIALAGLLFLLFLSILWVFGAPKPKRARATTVIRGVRGEDGNWRRDGPRVRDDG